MDTKALRQKILDLAIRGKLVPQDPNDEPASVLLERIRAEKQQMVKDGKLKAKDIKNDTVIFKGEDSLHYEKFADGSVKCIEDEIPFELPQGWEWTRLGVIFSHNTGKALNSKSQVGNPYTYITTSNLYWNRFELTDLKQMLFTDAELEKCTVKKGDLLVCEGGDIGRSAIWENDDEIRIQNHIHKMRPYIKLNIKFYYYVLYLYKHTERINGKGIGIQGLSSNQLHSLLFPLPPINEQNIIANKINGYFEYIDFLEKEKSNLSSAIQATKSKILDFAIRGKLVPQDPNDEPASVLLERIRAEKEELIKQGKIKRDKRESVIFKGEDNSYYEKVGSEVRCIDEELPFEIPDNWEWARLQTVCMPITDGTHKTPTYSEEGYTFLSSKNVVNGVIDWENVMHIPENLHNELYSRLSPQKNDILLAKNGTTGVAAIVDRDCVFDIYVTLALIRTVTHDISPHYLLRIIQSPVTQDYFKGSLKGIGVPNLHLEQIRTALIPICPFSEQQRITAKIKALFDMLDGIENALIE
ncbi:MAG: restriction endonuclease subunit S [Oscillospiraceae bacterium]